MLQFINDLIYHRIGSSDSDFRICRLGFESIPNHTLSIAFDYFLPIPAGPSFRGSQFYIGRL